MSTHNICFRQEIRKIICGYPLLSVAMLSNTSVRCSGETGNAEWSLLSLQFWSKTRLSFHKKLGVCFAYNKC